MPCHSVTEHIFRRTAAIFCIICKYPYIPVLEPRPAAAISGPECKGHTAVCRTCHGLSEVPSLLLLCQRKCYQSAAFGTGEISAAQWENAVRSSVFKFAPARTEQRFKLVFAAFEQYKEPELISALCDRYAQMERALSFQLFSEKHCGLAFSVIGKLVFAARVFCRDLCAALTENVVEASVYLNIILVKVKLYYLDEHICAV